MQKSTNVTANSINQTFANRRPAGTRHDRTWEKNIHKIRKKARIKGLCTPRCIVFLTGFRDAKILKTAGIDNDTGLICSSYITARTRAFESCCHARINLLEAALKPIRDEGHDKILEDQALIHSLAEVRKALNACSPDNPRETERLKNREKALMGSRLMIAKQLQEITDTISTEDGLLREEFQYLAKKIESQFASYANGMLLRRTTDQCIPSPDHIRVFDDYHARTAGKDAILTSYTKEVSHV